MILKLTFHVKRLAPSVSLSLAILLAGTFSQPSLAQATQGKPTKPLIVDTDMGTDDWLALTYIAQNPKIDLLGVTIVGNGLASCDQGPHNARYLLSMSDRNADKPIGCGSDWPLDGYASYPRVWRETGSDMMGEAPAPSQTPAMYPDGPTLLARLLKESDKPVEILAIGSLTNIATVIKTRPELKKKIARIISMGGAVDVPGNLRVHGFTDAHTNTKAEWNFYIDPVAGQIVLQSGIPITLIPIDTTNKVPLTDEFIALTQASPQLTPAQSFVARIFRKIKQSTTNGEYFHWDPLAAAVASRPELCEQTETVRLSVVTKSGRDSGPVRGIAAESFPLTNSGGGLRTALDEHAAGATIRSDDGGPVDVCLHVDSGTFTEEFLRTIHSR